MEGTTFTTRLSTDYNSITYHFPQVAAFINGYPISSNNTIYKFQIVPIPTHYFENYCQDNVLCIIKTEVESNLKKIILISK